MRHTYYNSIRRGNTAVHVAPSKFDRPEPKPDRSLSNYEVLELTRGRRILEVTSQERVRTSAYVTEALVA